MTETSSDDLVSPSVSLDGLRGRDAAAVGDRPDTVRAYGYEGGWYNNATFVFPFLAALGTLIAWGIFGGTELIGISIFFFVITGVMLPLVWVTWKRTPTVILLREGGMESLHQGASQQYLAWEEVHTIRRVETMGNVRWYVVGADEEHITLEGEIADLDDLLAAARRLAGLAPDRPPGSRSAGRPPP